MKNKYEILEKKLLELKECITSIEIQSEVSKKYLQQYSEYIDKLIMATIQKQIRSSNGALLGLTKGLSDYDELCSNKKLWDSAQQVDIFYSTECKSFD